MNRLYAAAASFQQCAESRGWSFCFIGGLAALRWGEPRMTRDVDVALLTGYGGEARFVDELLSLFAGRHPDARAFALRHRTLLLSAPSGVPIDVSLAALPFEEQMVERATPFTFAPGVDLVTCSAEDLLVQKAFAGRARDWADIEGILARQRGQVDMDAVVERTTRLCELSEDADTVARLIRLHRQVLHDLN